MNKKQLKYIAIFLTLTVFTKEIGMFEFGGIQWDLISYPFFTIMFFYFLVVQKIKLSKSELLLFMVLFIHGIINILIFNLPAPLFFKQFLPILIIYFTCKSIIHRYGVIKTFNIYIELSVLASILGLIQFILKLFGILFLTPYSQLFVDSVALEPSHYGALVLPAAVYLYEKKDFSWKFFTILLSLILTFKLTLVASILIFLVIRKSNKFIPLLVISPFLIYGFFIITSYNIEFTERINSMFFYFDNYDLDDVDNLTSFSFISNLEVAIFDFIKTFGMGVGFGGHETMYYRYYSDFDYMSDSAIGMNAKSAHSLLIRCISELGLISVFIAVKLFRGILKIKSIEYRAIALAAMSHFIVKSIKLGSYFDYGTIFFLVLIVLILKIEPKKKVIIYA